MRDGKREIEREIRKPSSHTPLECFQGSIESAHPWIRFRVLGPWDKYGTRARSWRRQTEKKCAQSAHHQWDRFESGFVESGPRPSVSKTFQNRVKSLTSLFAYNTITWPDSYSGSGGTGPSPGSDFARCDVRPIGFQSDPIDGERFEHFFLAFRMRRERAQLVIPPYLPFLDSIGGGVCGLRAPETVAVRPGKRLDYSTLQSIVDKESANRDQARGLREKAAPIPR